MAELTDDMRTKIASIHFKTSEQLFLAAVHAETNIKPDQVWPIVEAAEKEGLWRTGMIKYAWNNNCPVWAGREFWERQEVKQLVPEPAPPKADIESEPVKLKNLLPTKDIFQVVSFISRSDCSLGWVDIWQDAKQKEYAFTTSEGEHYGANHVPTIEPSPGASQGATAPEVKQPAVERSDVTRAEVTPEEEEVGTGPLDDYERHLEAEAEHRRLEREYQMSRV